MLTSGQRSQVEPSRRSPKKAATVRVRCQMVLLPADGWSPPCSVTHLIDHPYTVRAVLRRFQAAGATGLAPDTTRRAQVSAALDRLLDEPRTWTAALGAAGIVLSTRQTQVPRGRLQAHWRRMVCSLTHKQHPERVAKAEHTLGR